MQLTSLEIFVVNGEIVYMHKGENVRVCSAGSLC